MTNKILFSLLFLTGTCSMALSAMESQFDTCPAFPVFLFWVRRQCPAIGDVRCVFGLPGDVAGSPGQLICALGTLIIFSVHSFMYFSRFAIIAQSSPRFCRRNASIGQTTRSVGSSPVHADFLLLARLCVLRQSCRHFLPSRSFVSETANFGCRCISGRQRH